MPLTQYRFKHAVSAFFEMSRDAAKRALPQHLEAMEVKHSLGVFAVTAFDFTGSEVGNYEELVLAVITPPVLGVGGEFPRSAFYPFVVAPARRRRACTPSSDGTFRTSWRTSGSTSRRRMAGCRSMRTRRAGPSWTCR